MSMNDEETSSFILITGKDDDDDENAVYYKSVSVTHEALLTGKLVPSELCFSTHSYKSHMFLMYYFIRAFLALDF